MTLITVQDNSSKEVNNLDLSDLQKIADVKIGKLSLDDNPNLLVFPRDLKRYGDEISESSIISIAGNKISTGNIMGFVGVNGTQLDIKSRFAYNDENDYFLHYMLQKVFSINLFDIKHSSANEDIFDFLLYLFPYFLKKALSQGLYKKYRRFEFNDANIRGPIDVNRHIQKNIPFRGTVAYHTRTHSYDNEITQLVRHTIEYIKTKPHGSFVLSGDSDTKDCVSQIMSATGSYKIQERGKIIGKNLRPVRHPYFSAYTALQKICLQILRHETLKYGKDKDEIYGILFDGAWLWEEYLNTIFMGHLPQIVHAKNNTGENGIAVFKGGKKCYYPDFYILTNDKPEASHVYDAKYKRLNKGEIDESTETNTISICRDDLFQMITYLHVLPAQHCGLIYPLELDETFADPVYKSKSRILNGYGGEIFGIGIRISTAASMVDFRNKMGETEKELREEIGVYW